MGIFDDDSQDRHDHLPCFRNAEWEENDIACDSCLVAAQCRARQAEKRRTSYRPPQTQHSPPQSVHVSRVEPTRVRHVADSGRRTVLPLEEEHPLARLGKNALTDGLSAIGYSIGAFFKEYIIK